MAEPKTVQSMMQSGPGAVQSPGMLIDGANSGQFSELNLEKAGPSHFPGMIHSAGPGTVQAPGMSLGAGSSEQKGIYDIFNHTIMVCMIHSTLG